MIPASCRRVCPRVTLTSLSSLQPYSLQPTNLSMSRAPRLNGKERGPSVGISLQFGMPGLAYVCMCTQVCMCSKCVYLCSNTKLYQRQFDMVCLCLQCACACGCVFVFYSICREREQQRRNLLRLPAARLL